MNSVLRQPLIQRLAESIGHSRDIVPHRSRQPRLLGPLLILLRHLAWRLLEPREEPLELPLGVVAHSEQIGMAINAVVEESLQLPLFPGERFARTDEPARAAGLGGAREAAGVEASLSDGDDIDHLAID